MTIFTTPGRTAKKPFMSRGATASTLGISLAGVDKLIASGILKQNLRRIPIEDMAQRPELVVSDGSVTILRTTGASNSVSHQLGRKGFHVAMEPSEISDANLGWWRADADRVVANEIFVVTISTFPAAIFNITGIAASQGHGTERRHMFTGNLLWAIGSGLPTGDMRETCATIAGSRIYTESGGPIAYLGDA